MARPCTGCGIQVDALGKLVVASSGTWPFTSAGCTSASAGTGIYVAPDGTVHGAPEKFMTDIERSFVLETSAPPFSGQIFELYAEPYDGRDEQVGAISFDVVNPSPCRPAQLVIEQGIIHARWEKVGAGESRMFVNPAITVTGDVDFPAPALIAGPHQLWGHKGTVVNQVFDHMGSWQRTKFSNGGDLKLDAGGTASILLTGHLSVTAYNGNTTLLNVRYGVRVRLISL